MSDETIYRIGLEQDNAELHRINTELNWVVQDLIAELVGMADQGLDSGWAPLYEVADRAEARLREVQGEW